MIRFWSHITFANSAMFLLLVVPILLVLFYAWRNRELIPELKLSSLAGVRGMGNSIRGVLKEFPVLIQNCIGVLTNYGFSPPAIYFAGGKYYLRRN